MAAPGTTSEWEPPHIGCTQAEELGLFKVEDDEKGLEGEEESKLQTLPERFDRQIGEEVAVVQAFMEED